MSSLGKSGGRIVLGDKELDRKLAKLKKSTANKVAAAGVRGMLSVLVKYQRAAVKNPRVRPAIGSRFKKRRDDQRVVAVAGAGVGNTTKRQAQKATARASGGRPGVGISKNNVHWYILGTGTRTTRGGANRGRMPANDAIRRGTAAGLGPARAAMVQKAMRRFEKEVAKL